MRVCAGAVGTQGEGNGLPLIPEGPARACVCLCSCLKLASLLPFPPFFPPLPASPFAHFCLLLFFSLHRSMKSVVNLYACLSDLLPFTPKDANH
jgi:hypothetical protein